MMLPPDTFGFFGAPRSPHHRNRVKLRQSRARRQRKVRREIAHASRKRNRQ